jgi:short-subunit dehydrogenase
MLVVRYRTCLLTGASTGLGEAFARMLLAEGVRVWGTSRDVSRVPAGVRPLRLDLEDPDSIEEAWRTAEAESGGIDLLVNNAGSGVFGGFPAGGVSGFERQIDQLLKGPARLGARALEGMRARGRGCLVFVTSLAVEFPIPFMAGYDSGKAGLAALACSLGLEARTDGVTVIDFRPGDYRTGFNQSMARVSEAGEVAGATRVWSVLERNLARAPEPTRAARDLRRALLRGRGGVVRSGSFFQARLAPFLARFGTERLRRRLAARYFGLG